MPRSREARWVSQVKLSATNKSKLHVTVTWQLFGRMCFSQCYWTLITEALNGHNIPGRHAANMRWNKVITWHRQDHVCLSLAACRKHTASCIKEVDFLFWSDIWFLKPKKSLAFWENYTFSPLRTSLLGLVLTAQADNSWVSNTTLCKT